MRHLFSHHKFSNAFGRLLDKHIQRDDNSSYFALADRNIYPIAFSLDDALFHDHTILKTGLGKFWKKHKKEIIIIGVVAIVAITVIAIAVATNGAGAPMASAAGASALGGAQACLDDEPKKQSEHSNIDASSSCISTSFIEPIAPKHQQPLFLEEGVLLEDKYYSYWEFLEKSKIEEILSKTLSNEHALDPLPSSSAPHSPNHTPSYTPLRPQPGNSLTKHFIELFGREVIGKEFMADAPPSHLQKSHLFTTEGERSLSYQIGGINGINTSLDCAVDYADYIGRLTSGKSIDWVYNNSHGVLADLFLEVPANYSGMSPNTAQILTDNWVCFDQKNQDNLKAKYLQFCHSQGAIHVKNALENAPQEIRERVIVVAIAPAAVIPKKLCFQSTNYASKKDVVPLGELIFAGFNEPEIKQELLETAWQHHKELILLDPHPDATGIDHDFQSPTFTKIIHGRIIDYINCNGEYE